MPNNRLVVLLGSNINPEYHLRQALALIGEETSILQVSRVFETPPVGMQGENFLNAAILILTEKSPGEFKNTLLRDIEARLGRVRTEDKFIPRTIDLDIIIANDEVLDEEIFSHAHVCIPVADLMPELIEPVSGKTLRTLAEGYRRANTLRIRTDIKLSTTPGSPKS